ncbi:hypothetical protein ACFSC6_13645 [Rufibacter sediminis]|uniref:DUF4919 domain-containing protein n=1 Tax=Rufibacter sediminis TaxID=2762756 RepID=A0ABR6VYF7_9BACT|nr:hypothetical protein [Rufibacter sediminis]MBC3542237.1 hypothetical protein [Rufibacter sediminis]
MKKLYIIFLFISFNALAQVDEARISKIRGNTKIDNQDKAVLNLMEEFYTQMLQSDAGKLSPNTPEKLDNLLRNGRTRNRHLLVMFMVYQQHISQTAASGKRPDTKFQVELMTDLAFEFKNIYNEVPAIIYVYQSEALNSSGQNQEALKIIEEGLTVYPNSVPLKVYKYLGTKDDALKIDLIGNHSNHWMVKQFAIK